MSDREDLSPDDLEPWIAVSERAALCEVAARLVSERPAPRAGFRAELHAHLRDLGMRAARPAWLWPRVGALLLSGGSLLGLVGLGVVRIGPFAP